MIAKQLCICKYIGLDDLFIMDVTDRINTYLYFGYLPPKCLQKKLLNVWAFENEEFDYSVAGAIAKFDQLFDKLSCACHHEKIVVPISGGWDSRAILGALLERFDTKNIVTVSFGTPGQLDYDLGTVVSKSCKVQHHALDLRSVKMTWTAIVETAKTAPWTYIPDAYFNSICRKQLSDSQSSIWIGFLGESLAGSHIPGAEQQDISNYFVARQKKVTSIQLPEPTFTARISSQILKAADNRYASDMLDICIRQSYCVAPIVLPVKKWDSWDPFVGVETNGAQVIAPFADKDWAHYWLKAPIGVRRHQRLYLEMLKSKFGKLFNLPSKSSYGVQPEKRWLLNMVKSEYAIRKRMQALFPQFNIRSIKRENYLNFDEAFRKRDDYQETIFLAFKYLKKFEFASWLNFNSIWNDHLKRKCNYGDALVVILGLAANLAAEEIGD